MITRAAILGYLALLNGLPPVWGNVAAPGVTNGAFLAYGETNTDGFRRSARFVVDIIQGAKAQDLPVEMPTKYDLQINLRTARALGLLVPQDILLTATEIFESLPAGES